MARSRQIHVGLDADTEQSLREHAAERRTSLGLIARGLIHHGLTALLAGDEAAEREVAQVVAADRERRARVGRRVMTERHGGDR